MTFPIGGGNNDFNIGRTIQRSAEEHIKRALDPMGVFGQGFGSGGASGLFPTGKGGCGSIEETLAALSKKDKNCNFDTAGAGDSLFQGGKDMGQTGQGGGGGGGGMGDMLGGIMQGVMGLVKNLLGGLLGGGGGGGIMSMLGGL
jgi:hypothetical protein